MKLYEQLLPIDFNGNPISSPSHSTSILFNYAITAQRVSGMSEFPSPSGSRRRAPSKEQSGEPLSQILFTMGMDGGLFHERV